MPSIFDFLDVDAAVFAQQLTLATADLYSKITASECEAWQWLSKDNSMPAQTSEINAVIRHHNETHKWALRIMITPSDRKKQLEATHHLIDIANACFALNNFMSLAAIIYASTTDEAREATTNIDATAQTRLRQLQNLVTPTKGFIAFRRAIRHAELPCIPFLGISMPPLQFGYGALICLAF